ncbi:antitoxin [Mycolicibacterium hippocampi]|uniref:antitoxin n=1 Tax=Mycolicibacterium hippocampi TaxID=659824 RepID=UPI0035187D9B
MKLSVSLSGEDIAVLDDYIRRTGLPSRSAGVQRAVQMLRYPSLGEDYAEAWAEWFSAEGSEAWDDTVSDGVADAAR